MIFQFDASSRIITSSNAIANVADGLPFDASGALVVADGTLAPSVVSNGWPFDASGAVAIDDGGTISTYSNGLPFTAAGRLVADSAGAVVGFQNGLPYSTAGLSLSGSFDPLSYANIQFWYDFSDSGTVTESGGNISQLNDKSGNARNLTATLTARPTTGSTSTKGRAVGSYNGSSNIMATSSFSISQPTTIYIVGKENSYVDGAALFGGGTLFSGEEVLRVTGNKWQIYSGGTAVDGAASDLNQNVHTIIFNGASSAHYLNGTLSASGDPGANGFTGGFILGGRLGGFAASYWNGKIGEVLCYTGAHDASTRTAFNAYLSGRW